MEKNLDHRIGFVSWNRARWIEPLHRRGGIYPTQEKGTRIVQ